MRDQQLDPLIRLVEGGDPETRRQLFSSLYEQLHGIARRELRRNGGALTLGATTLLHEAYLNLGERRGLAFPDQARFLSYASRAMRGFLLHAALFRRAFHASCTLPHFDIAVTPSLRLMPNGVMAYSTCGGISS